MADAVKLSVPARIRLVGDIWDSIADEGSAVPLTAAHKRELDRRLRDWRKDPKAGVSWAVAKARILRVSRRPEKG